MHIEFLVEELSAEVALRNLVPKIVSEEVTFEIHYYQGQSALLRKLPQRLQGYKQWLPPDWRIVILIDQDREDCRVLKSKKVNAAREISAHMEPQRNRSRSFQVFRDGLLDIVNCQS